MMDRPRGQHGLQDFVSTLAADDEPGFAVGSYAGGELTAWAAAGCANLEHRVPVTERTAFDIASVSKHLTSTCLLLLARDGFVDLDADIRAWLPELALTKPVTLRQCLTHTAGLRDYFALCDIAGIPVTGMGEERFVDLVTGQAELDFPPGSSFSYSNTGYALAAVLARRLTGAGLAQFAADRVFGPLGMTATRFRDDVSLLVPRLAAGYVAGPGGSEFRRCDVTENVVGDGAIVTTIADLAGWHSFMASGAVLGTDLRDALPARQVLTDGTRIGYALGLESIEVGGQPAWWHSGSWAGYRAAVIYLPAERAGVSVLANRNDRYASHIAYAVATALRTGADLRSCYQALAGIPVPAPDARRKLGEILGRWHEPAADLFIEFHQAGPDQVALRERGEEHRFLLAEDGWWHGTGSAASQAYAVGTGELLASWGLSARPEGRYRRAGKPVDSPPSPGIFLNEELRAYAEIRQDESGVATITIGLAPPRTLKPAGPGAWQGVSCSSGADGGDCAGEVTVRVAQDGGLRVSVPGARHVRFDPVGGVPARVIRGLRAAR